MGLHFTLARGLLSAIAAGARLDRTLMLGRLTLSGGMQDKANRPRLVQEARRYGVEPVNPQRFLESDAPHADELLRMLGAATVEAMDYSDYEGATVLHDLNNPLPADLYGRYDMVIDGGTLEHVFNYPQALKNAMNLVKVGGTLLICTTANNAMGHGFYCFSPELFYVALSEANGYRVQRMLLYENRTATGVNDEQLYEVADPRQLRARVQYIADGYDSGLIVDARKTAQVEVFAQAPQQTDYVAAWSQHQRDNDAAHPAPPAPAAPPARSLPYRIARRLYREVKRRVPALSRRGQTALRPLALTAQPHVFKPVDR